MVNVHSIKMEDFLDAKCTAACWNDTLLRGTQASTSAVTASTSGANIAYWSLVRANLRLKWVDLIALCVYVPDSPTVPLSGTLDMQIGIPRYSLA